MAPSPEYTYDRLDLAQVRDRAGRVTSFEHNRMRQLVKRTDPLGRATFFDWCSCGALKSLTDPMGRTTSWLTDVQGRPVGKEYADGSQVQYTYDSGSRLLQVLDEKRQVTAFAYNPDNTLKSIAYFRAAVPTPGVTFTYDTNYIRLNSRTDGTGSTRYQYYPVTSPPSLGAGRLAGVDGPLTNATIRYVYDELGRHVSTTIDGVASTRTFDAAGRVVGEGNALGSFSYGYDGPSGRLVSEAFPNGQAVDLAYGSVPQDLALQRITYHAGVTPISEFLYTHDLPKGRTTTWSQQAGAQTPLLYTLGYDDANQLVSAAVTSGGSPVNSYAYSYDPAGNRLTEQGGATSYTATYNALNQLSTSTEPGSTRTNEWDAAGRLAAVNDGNQRTEFAYDGLSRLVGIRKLVNGAEVSHRLLVWGGGRLAEERDTNGVVTKRFFGQGVRIETGPNAGPFYYTRDHLGSLRELTDATGTIRARYAYDPFGRRTKVSGDAEADFGFAGMFWATEANLCLTRFRAYDPELGRWLSRDPLHNAELREGANLYGYVLNEPVDRIDPDGLCFDSLCAACAANPGACAVCGLVAAGAAEGGEAITEALPTVAEEAPAVAESAGGCAADYEVLSTEIQPEDIPPEPQVADIGERAADLADTWEEEGAAAYQTWSQQMQNWEFGLMGAGGTPPPLISDPVLISLDNVFNNLAQALSARSGLSFSESWRAIALAVGFDPDDW